MGRQIKFNIGIIGCGLIGQRRAKHLGKKGVLIACADTNIKNANKIALKKNILIFTNWKKLIEIKELDIIFVSTYHNKLCNIVLESYKKGKHVFVEKPGAKNFIEIKRLIKIVKNKNIKIKVGFNHRYHQSIVKSKNIIKSGALGNLMYIRGRYGHGGRLGYENEWRAKKKIAGGGELLDQGSHLIDLSRMFLGNFNKVSGFINTYFWKMSVEDNAFLTLRTANDRVAFLHASWTEWKNLFSLEIFGTKGKLDISGKGGSYGLEQLIFYKMTKKMNKPKAQKWSFKDNDTSWKNEINDFYNDIIFNKEPSPNLKDAYETLKIINQVYKS